jgi:membrane-bound serine protease (ClpP class)
VATIAATLLLAAPAQAAPVHRVDVVKVSGLIDPINADLLSHSLHAAAREHATLLVWQLNSTGGRLPASLLPAVAASPVPIAVWIGGSNKPRALGAAWTLARAADFVGEAPGSRVGNGPPPPGKGPDGLEHRTMSGDDAADAHLLDEGAPTLPSFIGDLNGHTFRGVDIVLSTGRGFSKDVQFAFSQLSILPKLLHTAASPNVAFAMFVIALSLVVFEFFTAGVGVAAGTAILFGALAAYGLAALPTRPYAVALLALAMFGFAIDVQSSAPRFWTTVGVLAFVAGSLRLYDGHAVSPWVIVVMGVLLVLFMIGGMPAMIRTRFSTPTIGRESMVGTEGVALSDVSPEGTVEVNGAPWRARTNRATPIEPGERVRVVAIDGLLLEVERDAGPDKPVNA